MASQRSAALRLLGSVLARARPGAAPGSPGAVPVPLGLLGLARAQGVATPLPALAGAAPQVGVAWEQVWHHAVVETHAVLTLRMALDDSSAHVVGAAAEALDALLSLGPEGADTPCGQVLWPARLASRDRGPQGGGHGPSLSFCFVAASAAGCGPAAPPSGSKGQRPHRKGRGALARPGACPPTPAGEAAQAAADANPLTGWPAVPARHLQRPHAVGTWLAAPTTAAGLAALGEEEGRWPVSRSCNPPGLCRSCGLCWHCVPLAQPS